ncbi:MAG: hypothetical protein A3K60_01315 [Euryarchaeota archaeon RBG_19FT_COMBO_56_21]|nr:MAG: hypothetical protein A3K60_01315 [Euryarchaeota archaeon RBG_19FT_COMBO_56_21]
MSRASRMRREKRTVRAMVRMYCSHHHASPSNLCSDCDKLIKYSETRVDRCVYKQSKPTCAKCPIHCYEPLSRERMKAVMRYTGPRMLYTHPYLAIAHALDSARKPRK